MLVHYGSDFHLEFGACSLPGGDVLILAGDVCEARSLVKDFHSTKSLPHVPGSHEHRYYDFFYHECAKYDQVFYVLGNHCHYHGRFDKTYDQLKAILPANVTLLENEIVEYKGIIWAGATLWTDINKGDPITAQVLKGSMNDYTAIQCHYPDRGLYHKLTPEHTAKTHHVTKQYFRETLRVNPDQQFVIITHHAPSTMSISEQYRGDFHMNGGYASDLSEFLLDHPQIKVHIHGHTHSNFSYDIGTTRVLCRPRGYKGHEQIAENFEIGSFEITDDGEFKFTDL